MTHGITHLMSAKRTPLLVDLLAGEAVTLLASSQDTTRTGVSFAPRWTAVDLQRHGRWTPAVPDAPSSLQSWLRARVD